VVINLFAEWSRIQTSKFVGEVNWAKYFGPAVGP